MANLAISFEASYDSAKAECEYEFETGDGYCRQPSKLKITIRPVGDLFTVFYCEAHGRRVISRFIQQCAKETDLIAAYSEGK
jgi:hypothetical protein